MTSSGTFHVVRFACYPADEPKVHLLTDAQHDRWCMCEPPEGYREFTTLHTFDLDEVPAETLVALAKIADQSGTEPPPAVD